MSDTATISATTNVSNVEENIDDKLKEYKTALSHPQQQAPSTSTQQITRKRGYKKLRIQPTRVKRVMQSDDNIGRMTIEAPVALTAATERFVDQLLTRTVRAMEMAKTNTKTIQLQHLKLAVQMDPSLRFLEAEFSEVADMKNAGAILQYVDEVAPIMNSTSEVNKFIMPERTTPQIEAATETGTVEKRRRGRPRKDEISTPKQPVNNNIVLTANGKKRGRPRKSAPGVDNENSTVKATNGSTDDHVE